MKCYSLHFKTDSASVLAVHTYVCVRMYLNIQLAKCYAMAALNHSFQTNQLNKQRNHQCRGTNITVTYCCNDMHQKDLNRNDFELKADKTHSSEKIANPEI